ncbi:N-alpha-acetyltransferase 30 [Ochotona princeps]|uniref:N-alpha-acetyltransferase 30 n=1 Tax=Ochotona princeps TaxID=9978 RepID=UPI002714DDD8|nr:N-alpha-acetyltransferase 30 [Ochotona princeps]
MAEVPPGPSSLLPPPAPPAPAAAEPRCPFPAGAALACCSDDEDDDEEREAAAQGRPCVRCPPPQPQPQPQQQQQLNGLISPELRHLRAAASLKSKVLTNAAGPDGDPRATATDEGSPPPAHPHEARTALPSPALEAAAAARNGLAEGAGRQQQQQQQRQEEDNDDQEEQVRLLSASLSAGCSVRSPSGREVEPGEDRTIRYVRYESELQMPDIMRLITKDLSEPYSIYTYRYFIHNWPQLCFLAVVGEECVGAIVCKLDMHKKMFRRGYIAMLAVDSKYRRNGIGTNLVKKAIYAMVEGDCDEVVLETEITNKSALKLYENLGFVRDKRLFRYYLNGVDALRLKLWLR